MPTYEVFIDGKPHKVEVVKASEERFSTKIDGKPANVEFASEKPSLEKPFALNVDGKTYRLIWPKFERDKPFAVMIEGIEFRAEVKTPIAKPTAAAFTSATAVPVLVKKSLAQRDAVEGAVTAPMTGKIMSVKVKKSDAVKEGQVVCVIEAMKMENEIVAPKTGVVQEVSVQEGSSVSEGETLLVIA